MTTTNLIKKLNARMNYESFSYEELSVALDAAIDRLNTEWRTNFPMITDQPEMEHVKVSIGNGQYQDDLAPSVYYNLPEDFLRQYVIPYAAGYQYMINGQDGGIETMEALTNLAALSVRYPVEDGMTTLELDPKSEDFDPSLPAPQYRTNFKILIEDRKDMFASGNHMYAVDGSNDPFGEY